MGLIVATLSGAFLFGMLLSLLGSIKFALAERLQIGEFRIGSLLAALNLALIPMMLLSGVLIDTLGVRVMLIVGSVLTATAIFGLSLRLTYSWAFAAILGAGLGGACVSTASTVLMPVAFEARPAAALNLGNVFFALGALVTPTLADTLLRITDLRRTLGFLALLCLVPAGVAAGFKLPDLDKAAAGMPETWNASYIWLAGIILLLYSPIESTLAAWTTTFLADLGYRERRAAWHLSSFWLAFLTTRLLAYHLQHFGVLVEWTDPWFIMLLGLGAGILLGHLAGTPAGGRAGLELLALGACLGPIFPTLIGIVFENTAVPQRGKAYGAVFAIGATGNLVLAPLIGGHVRRGRVQSALYILMLLALLMVGAVLVMALWRH